MSSSHVSLSHSIIDYLVSYLVVKLFVILLDTQDGGVGFEIYLFTALDGFKPFDRDILLVPETQADYIKHHIL